MKIHPSEINFDWKADKVEELDFSECTYMTVWHHSSKERDFTTLPKAPHLRTLNVYFTNVETLKGLEKYPNLQYLELDYCRNLMSLEGIESLKDNLKTLLLFHTKKVKDYSLLAQLENLEDLRICDSGTIESINFILKLKKLTAFTFLDSNVVDGNLYPLLEHNPPLERIYFNNKRHYSHTEKDIAEQTISGRELDELFAKVRAMKE